VGLAHQTPRCVKIYKTVTNITHFWYYTVSSIYTHNCMYAFLHVQWQSATILTHQKCYSFHPLYSATVITQ